VINLTERNKGRLAIAATAVLWGLAGVCVKTITWSSFSIMAVRSFISLLMLLAARRSLKIQFTRANVAGAVTMMLTGTLYMEAIKLTSAGTAIVLQYVAPIFVYLYHVLFRGRRVRLAELFIILAVFGGCVLSFADNSDAGHLLGNILALCSGLTYAAQIIIMNGKNCSSEDSTILGNLFACVLCFPFLFFDGGLSFSRSNILWLLIMSVFQYGVANMLFIYGIDRVESIESSLILTIEPVFNPIPVAIFCGELMGPKAIAGSVIVIAFVALYGALPALEARHKHRTGTS